MACSRVAVCAESGWRARSASSRRRGAGGSASRAPQRAQWLTTLVASGYTAAEIDDRRGHRLLKFEDPPLIGRIPRLGWIIDLIRHYGLYKGDYFHNLMRNLLAAKGVPSFPRSDPFETA